MTAHLAAWGRLVADPREIATRSGTAMTVARMAVDAADPRNASEGREAEPLWLSLVAFGDRLAPLLAGHGKGEPISVAGRVQMRTRQGRDGEDVTEMQVICDSVVSARTPRPRGGGRRQSGPARREATGGNAAVDAFNTRQAIGDKARPFDDPLPF